MTWDRSLYPDNWEQIAHDVKQAANWHCEECGRPCRKPGESLQAMKERVQWNGVIEECWPSFELEWQQREVFALYEVPKPTRFVLTVAHLNHNPEDCRRENLKALCSVCHLKYDNTESSRFRKQQVKAERAGQLLLPV